MIAILNDVHLGVSRSAGTTMESSKALRVSLLLGFERLMRTYRGKDVVILGDLFDSGDVDGTTLVGAIVILTDWLKHGGCLDLVAGNHDLNKDSSKKSSFHVLATALQAASDSVQVFTSPGLVSDGVYVIPHCVNQQDFDAALEAVPACDFLLLHANYNNGFAARADHSLNVSEEQAAKSLANKLVFAHEHQAKTALGGKVQIIGNQLASSISDCLGNDTKRLAYIVDGCLSFSTVSHVADYFAQVDWRDASAYREPMQFIRVVGEATEAEATDAAEAVSILRRESSAFVVGNNVRVAGVSLGDLGDMVDDIQGFDTIAALRKMVTDPEHAAVLEEAIGTLDLSGEITC